MAEVYKILGQIATSDTTEQILYSSPASTQSIITNITAVNRTSSAQTFDVSVFTSVPSVASVTNNFYVALPYSSSPGTDAIYSTDGITWTARTLPSAQTWTAITYGSNLFVATSQSTTAASSTDGLTWTLRTITASQYWNSVAYGGGKYVAVSGADGSLSQNSAYSTNGITWTSANMPTDLNSNGNPWYSVTYGNGKFVAVSGTYNFIYFGPPTFTPTPTQQQSNFGAYSTDGITWSSMSLPTSTDWRSLAFGNGVFVAVPYDGSTTAASSTDGITWTTRTLSTADSYFTVAYGNGIFVATANTNAVTSTNGITWTTRTLPASKYFHRLAYGNGLFVTVARNSTAAATSTDGITWTLRTTPSSNGYSAIAFGNPTVDFASPLVNNLYKSVTIQANASEILEPGVVLGAQNSIVVKGTANTTFSAYGVEIS